MGVHNLNSQATDFPPLFPESVRELTRLAFSAGVLHFDLSAFSAAPRASLAALNVRRNAAFRASSALTFALVSPIFLLQVFLIHAHATSVRFVIG